MWPILHNQSIKYFNIRLIGKFTVNEEWKICDGGQRKGRNIGGK